MNEMWAINDEQEVVNRTSEQFRIVNELGFVCKHVLFQVTEIC